MLDLSVFAYATEVVGYDGSIPKVGGPDFRNERRRRENRGAKGVRSGEGCPIHSGEGARQPPPQKKNLVCQWCFGALLLIVHKQQHLCIIT